MNIKKLTKNIIKKNNKQIAIALAKKKLKELFNNKYHTVDVIPKEQLNNK